MALAEATKEAIWLKSLLGELGENVETVPLHEDNQACIRLAEAPVTSQRSKHIDIRYHFIRHHVKNGNIRIVYVPTAEQIADGLTKLLPRWKIENFRYKTLDEGFEADRED